MDQHYERFCVTDPHFYDSLTSARPGANWFAAARQPVPDGWRREARDDSLVYGPAGATRPDPGWTIHISACLDNADRILDDVFGYCRNRGLPFEFVHGRAALLMRNAKYARRGTSGKFITVYPRDEAELEIVCHELGDLIDGEPGPYILSDLRLGNGPLHVHPPPGARVPAFLAPRLATTVVDLPYHIDDVIHVSNGGALYAAIDTRTGDRVVLKEAQPHAGLDADGVDAITRLDHEHAALDRLAGLADVPRVHDRFPLGEHEFLALEHIDGRPLHDLLAARYPMTDPDAGDAEYHAYTRWALDIYRQVERTVEAVHERGLVHGDLHPGNVLVRTGADTAVLVDFEVAGPADGYRRPGLRNQGFAAPAGVTGRDIDRYALACLRLAMFLPLTALLRLAPEKAGHFATVIARHFDVPAAFLAEAVATITAAAGSAPPNRSRHFARPAPNASAVPTLRSIAEVIVDSATPGRDDRLFPGDIEQFHSGGLNIAYGAAGVLYALKVTGAGRFPEFEDWLVTRALRPGSGVGFYDGLHGVAYTLHELGRHQDALDVLDRCLDPKGSASPASPSAAASPDGLGPGLMSGLAGIGLNLLHLARATGEPALLDAAGRTTDRLADRLTSSDPLPRAGLLHGWTGPALLFLRMHEQSGDPTLLDHAVTAIHRDLTDEVRPTTPYLANGSTGIGIVLDQIRRHRDDDRLARASDEISSAARTPFHPQSGLFGGRAGIIRYLAGHDRDADRLATQIRNLAWHAVPYRGGLAFPGDRLLRLSMDLATGSAGVLLALSAARRDPGADLPFLTPPHRR